METAKIRCKVGAFKVKRDLPNGGSLVVRWTEKNDFIADVPVHPQYVHPFDKQKVVTVSDNWAQTLLNAYDFLELVEIKKEDAVVQPQIKKTKTKKEKEHEEAVV